MLDSLLSVKEASKALAISSSTVYRLVEQGRIPFIKMNGLGLRFRRDDLDEWLQGGTFKPAINPASLLASPVYAIPHQRGGLSSEMAKAKSKARLRLALGAVYPRKTKGGNIRWYLDYRDRSGNRIKELVPLAATQWEAVLALQEAVRKEFDAEYGLKRQREKTTFKELSAMYLEDYAKQNKKSWKDDQYRIEANMNPYFEDAELSDITPQQIEQYKAKRKADFVLPKSKKKNQSTKSKKPKLVSPSTINREITILKKMFNLAIDWNLIEQNPVVKVKLFSEKGTKQERILKADEEPGLLLACPDYLRPIVVLALNTGMRRGEILNLRWRQVDLEGRFITVENTKGGQSRMIPINYTLFQEFAGIKAQGGSSEFVFPNPKTGKPFTEVKNSFKKACRTVGIHDLRFHDLRHSFATRLIEAGVDIVTVKELLGHFSVTVTQRYTHPGQLQKKLAVGLLTAKTAEKQAVLEHRRNMEEPEAVEIPVSNSDSIH